MTDLEVYINTRGFLDALGARPSVSFDAVALAEDLRAVDPTSGIVSSPRIARAVIAAIHDAGLQPRYAGKVPTPTLAAWAGTLHIPCVMITGSHIPADRNGVKFYTPEGEVLKSDETEILAAVSAVRAREYAKNAGETRFDARGMLRDPPPTPDVEAVAAESYVARYTDPFGDARPLAGKRIVLYQHSAVGRDLLARIFSNLGAEVIPTRRSETFVPVDTEDVDADDLALFETIAAEHPGAFAIISTDGDSDRPLVIDEDGTFYRGDVLGVVVAEYLGATFAAVPVSASDAIERHLAARAAADKPTFTVARTRIGSPYVIAAMNQAVARGEALVCGWESNGGFLTANDVPFGDGSLPALPTRDATLPILVALLAAAERNISVSALFAELPPRFTGAGLIDDFPREASAAILAALRPADDTIVDVDLASLPSALSAQQREDLDAIRERLTRYFRPDDGFGAITHLNLVDGVRIGFDNDEIVHLRPSGNAPQLRIYAVSDSAERCAEIIALGLRESDGLLRRLERDLAAGRLTKRPETYGNGDSNHTHAARRANLTALREIVARSAGPRQVLAITNGG
ncbi:MAG: hypothetical protein KAI47_11385, partial [Deltaproteobacteria bacterium]|nr:hypothetical protein [Deltaproteobacteria bacterium]